MEKNKYAIPVVVLIFVFSLSTFAFWMGGYNFERCDTGLTWVVISSMAAILFACFSCLAFLDV